MHNLAPILHVEDEEDDVFFFQKALSKAGIANPVIHVSDGKAAFDYLSGNGTFVDRQKYPFPCLLIVDLKLPMHSGFDLVARIRPIAKSQGISVIILSSSVASSDKERCLEMGADDYFVKPPRLNELVSLALELKKSWLS